MHDQTTHRTLFKPFGIHDFLCSMQTKPRTERYLITLLGIHDFVQQVVRYDSDFSSCEVSFFIMYGSCCRHAEHFQIQQTSAIMTALFNLNKGISHAKSKR